PRINAMVAPIMRGVVLNIYLPLGVDASNVACNLPFAKGGYGSLSRSLSRQSTLIIACRFVI
ncbi:MAG: hypothetical protein ACYDBZ_18665, partial [Steroidobacteraceae bacterium]